MKTLIITGGRFDKEFAASFLQKNKYDYTIVVDYGLAYAESLEIIPDMIVGDFDTLGTEHLDKYRELGTNIRKFNPHKDDTDTEIAVREAVELKSDFDIIGATGGRIDHLLANIHNLKIALDAGYTGRLVDEGNIVFLRNKSFTISREEYPAKYISFVPFDGEVRGITLKGFEYPLDNYTLMPGISRCISNELKKDSSYGTVEFASGCLIVINSHDVKR